MQPKSLFSMTTSDEHPTMNDSYQKPVLFAASGCGNTCIEAVLELIGLPYDLISIPFADVQDPVRAAASPAIIRLAAYNPLKQFPTFITEEGAVITESAAILSYIAEAYRDRCPDAKGGWVLKPDVVTEPQDAAAFHRWLEFTSVNLYAVIAINDFPKRWLPEEMTGQELNIGAFKEKLDARLFVALDILETHGVKGPYILGETMTSLDI
ncbi:hypothetical protein DFJ77DRAFT_465837 [Powellomyces hirtus]|nr:hypothetical protein DFJ77DRAFT_465837 [Powellomyces hirtus]